MQVLVPWNLYKRELRAVEKESLFVASMIIKALVVPIDFNNACSIKSTNLISEFFRSSL